MCHGLTVLREKSVEWAVITVVFIRLKKKKKLAPIMYRNLCCTVGGRRVEGDRGESDPIIVLQ